MVRFLLYIVHGTLWKSKKTQLSSTRHNKKPFFFFVGREMIGLGLTNLFHPFRCSIQSEFRGRAGNAVGVGTVPRVLDGVTARETLSGIQGDTVC